MSRVRLGLWILFVGYYWFDVIHTGLAETFGSDASSGALLGAALLALAGRVGAQIVEAGFYTAVWRLVARRVRFAPVFLAVLSLSLCDACAETLLRLIGTDPAQPWLAGLVGFRALPGVLSDESGFRIAFGSLGLLALGRMLGTVYAQRREGAPWRGALALTLAAAFASRMTTWWTTDLMRGMSPLP